MIFDLLHTKTGVSTATQLAAGIDSTPRLGTVYFERAAAKKWIYLKNNAATAIAAQLATRALTTDKTSFFAQVCSTTITANELMFAGVRVTSSTSLAQNENGWFQIGGSATMTAASDTTTADTGVCTSNISAGQVEAAADSAAGIRGTFGISETTTASADVVVKLFFSVWGV